MIARWNRAFVVSDFGRSPRSPDTSPLPDPEDLPRTSRGLEGGISWWEVGGVGGYEDYRAAVKTPLLYSFKVLGLKGKRWIFNHVTNCDHHWCVFWWIFTPQTQHQAFVCIRGIPPRPLLSPPPPPTSETACSLVKLKTKWQELQKQWSSLLRLFFLAGARALYQIG